MEKAAGTAADAAQNAPDPASSSNDDTILPQGDLTIDRMDEFLALPDRQKMRWALQTETRVRLNKVEHRFSSLSDTLQSGGYLFQVYPDTSIADGGGKLLGGELDRDRYEYQRLSLEFLRTARNPDASWNALPALLIIGHDQDPNALQNKPPDQKQFGKQPSPYETAPVPPNMLFFRILIEAFVGYKWPSFHSSDPDMPRCAVMGGAVVAALTAWRDDTVVEIFQAAGLERFLEQKDIQPSEEEIQNYLDSRKALHLRLNNYFIYSFRESPFADGDVDVFLQASPAFRGFIEFLMKNAAMGPLPIERILSFVGGVGQNQDQLQKMATTVVDSIIESDPDFEEWRSPCLTGLVFALAHNGLSFQLAAEKPWNYKEKPWPRSSQMIMLKPQADFWAAS